jgi:EF-P beta-lysylation protein EpmB
MIPGSSNQDIPVPPPSPQSDRRSSNQDIPVPPPSPQSDRRVPDFLQVPAWQQALAQAVTDPAELLASLNLEEEWLPAAQAAARLFRLRVPQGFVARMRKGDPHDPLLRQVLPLAEECVAAEGYSADPVGDLEAMEAPGVIHKYRGRVLLTATGACAVHCRYCFRRHFPFADASASTDRWRAALDCIAADDSIAEVILSGGDPLMLTDWRLAELIEALQGIRHVTCLRVHTRVPIVLPERVTDPLLGWLAGTRLQPVMVVHANHPRELDVPVATALARLKSAGVTLLNQSVLLRGVNDDTGTLAQLSAALFGAGVLPYYLHLLDRAQGTAHFDVPEPRARALHEALRRQLPGYLVPRLVREIPGDPAKRNVERV